MAEHMVLDNLLEHGMQEEVPEGDEEKEQLNLINAALIHAKTLGEGEQAEYLFENATTGELIFDKAYQVASTALYIEDDELAFHLSEIDSHFDDEDNNENDEPAKELSEEEKEFASLLSNAPKKDASQLN